jgi:branched-subunit amino acid aminotransferase/4-amino-4-deoxychorismate lyase
VQSGLGAFETLAVRDGLPLDWSAHLDRLRASASRLDVALPDGETLAAAAAGIASRVEGGCGWLRVVALRDGPCAIFGGPIDPEEEGRPTSAVVLPWRRSPSDPLAGFKTMNYAAFVLGLEEARRRGADEGLWLNTRGHLSEGCTSNVFVISGRKLFTPAPRDGILPGVTRVRVLAAARQLGLAVHEGKVRLKRLERAGEAFLSSSVRGIRPLVMVDGKKVRDGQPGPVTRAIAERVRASGKAGESVADRRQA